MVRDGAFFSRLDPAPVIKPGCWCGTRSWCKIVAVKSPGKPKFTAEIIDPILASEKAEEIQSSSDLFAFAFLLAGRRMLSIDDALDTLYAHGLPDTTPRTELAERMLAGLRTDRTFVPYYGTSFTLNRGADIDERIFQAFMGPSARERLAADTRRAKQDARRRSPLFGKPVPPPRRAPDQRAQEVTHAESAPVPRMPPAPPPLPVPVTIAAVTEAEAAALQAASVRLKVDGPRPGPVAAVARAFALRNGVARVVQVSISATAYTAGLVEYTITSPEPRQGLRWVIVGPDGSEPDETLGLLLDPGASLPAADPVVGPGEGTAAARWIARRSPAVLRAAVQPFAQSVAAKQAREYARIAAAFETRWADAHRSGGGGLDTEARAIETENLVAERDTLLHGLAERFAIRAVASVTRVLQVNVPAGVVTVRVRRRSVEREVVLRMPAGTDRLDRLACEGCGKPTARPAGCGARLHLLCERCAPVADGKITCPACGA